MSIKKNTTVLKNGTDGGRPSHVIVISIHAQLRAMRVNQLFMETCLLNVVKLDSCRMALFSRTTTTRGARIIVFS